MSVGVRPQPYRLDPPSKEGIADAFPAIITNADEMFQMLFEDMKLLDDSVGSGTLGVAAGGTGLAIFTPYAVVAGGTAGTTPLQQVAGVGSSGQLLTSNGAAALPTWQAAPSPSAASVGAIPINRKFFATWQTDNNIRTFNAAGSGTIGLSAFQSFDNTTPTVVTDTTSTWNRCTTSGALNGSGGLRNSTLDAPMFAHLPTVVLHFRTGSSITNSRYWIGLFDNTSQTTNPGTSTTGVNIGKHVGIRYVDGTDTQWKGSAGDGTTQSTSSNIAAIAASTEYFVKIRFTSNLVAAISVNGGTEQTVTLASSAADTTAMTVAIYVFNNTASSHVIDVANIYGEYN
jgi:hypothetical protein